jgi:hypothetical protein
MFAGCTHNSHTSAELITKSDDLLYIATSTHDIRVFNSKNNRWESRLNIPTMVNPLMSNLISDNGNIIFSAWDINQGVKKGVFAVDRDHNIKTLTNQEEALVSLDDKYYYFMTRSCITGGCFFEAFRYDKNFTEQIKFHFDHNPNLLIRSICEDEQYYWYVCLHSNDMKEHRQRGPNGRIVLLRKSKFDGEIKEYNFETKDLFEINAVIDNGQVWIFAWDENYQTDIIGFTKKEEKFRDKTFKSSLIPFPNYKSKGKSKYLWAIEDTYRSFVSNWVNKLYRVDSETLEVTQIDLGLSKDFNFQLLRAVPFRALYDDGEFLWAGMLKKHQTITGFADPYILKISKDDMKHELIVIQPTIGEALSTLFFNTFGWLIIPFIHM